MAFEKRSTLQIAITKGMVIVLMVNAYADSGSMEWNCDKRSLGLIERQSRLFVFLAIILALLLLQQTRSASNVNPLLSSGDSPPLRDHVDQSSHIVSGENKDTSANGFRPNYGNIDWNEDDKSDRMKYAEGPTIAKVSMLYGQNPQSSYVRALRSHRVHNRRFNYGMFVLEEDAVGGFWNKPLYLLSLLMQELSKPPSERLQWLM